MNIHPCARPPKQRQDRIEYLFLEIGFIEKYQNVENLALTYKALYTIHLNHGVRPISSGLGRELLLRTILES